MIVYMRGKWGLLPKAGALALAFGGTVGAVDEFRIRDSFSPVIIDAQLDSRADAYIPIVRQTKKALMPDASNHEQFRKLARVWIHASKSGKIKQIYPGYCGESLLDGPKGEIFSSACNLANRLSEISELEAIKHDPRADEDALLSMELINIVRFGNYETLFSAGSYMRRPIRVLGRHVKSLSPKLLARLAADQNPKVRTYRTELLARIAKHQEVQYAARYGSTMAKQDQNNYGYFLRNSKTHIAANHFYGFDRENRLVAKTTK